MNLHILDSVKGVVSVKGQIVDDHVLTVHGKVISLCCDVIQFNAITAPQRLCRVGKGYMFERHIMAPAKIFRRFNRGILYRNVIGVPDPCAAHFKPGTVFRRDVFCVPKGIFPLEHTPVQFDIPTFLERGFALRKNRIVDFQVAALKKRTFSGVKTPSDFFFIAHKIVSFADQFAY